MGRRSWIGFGHWGSGRRIAGDNRQVAPYTFIDMRKARPYTPRMIKMFRSKALKRLWEDGDASKLPMPNVGKVERILARLDASASPEDMNLPGWRFHGLQGKPKRFAVDASGNYRVTFGWDDAAADAIDVDIEDYH